MRSRSQAPSVYIRGRRKSEPRTWQNPWVRSSPSKAVSVIVTPSPMVRQMVSAMALRTPWVLLCPLILHHRARPHSGAHRLHPAKLVIPTCCGREDALYAPSIRKSPFTLPQSELSGDETTSTSVSQLRPRYHVRFDLGERAVRASYVDP